MEFKGKIHEYVFSESHRINTLLKGLYNESSIIGLYNVKDNSFQIENKVINILELLSIEDVERIPQKEEQLVLIDGIEYALFTKKITDLCYILMLYKNETVTSVIDRFICPVSKENLDVGFFLFNASDNCIYFNEWAINFLKQNGDQIKDLRKVLTNQSYSSFLRKIFKAFKTKGNFSVELYQIDSNRCFQAKGKYVYHSGKESIVGSIKDVTEEKALFKRLLLMEKMKSLGSLSCGLAHDLNNQLMSVQGSTFLLQAKLKDESLFKYVDNIDIATRKTSDLIQKLNAFQIKDTFKREEINAKDLLLETIDLLNSSLKDKVSLNIYDYEISCKGNYSLLQSAILSIILNALETDKDDLCVGVNLTKELIDEIPLNAVNEAPINPQGYIKMEIIDNGNGIQDDVLKSIFDPFFTTKGYAKSSGLGLSTSLNTIIKHDGFLTLDTDSNGTVFTIYLPIIKEKGDTSMGKVLLVDDDEIVLDVLSEMVRMIGYEPIAFTDAFKAISYYDDFQESIDLVMIDMIMPLMNGKELFLNINKINPKAKTLILSGYSEEKIISDVMQLGCSGFLSKPVIIRDLKEKIESILDDEYIAYDPDIVLRKLGGNKEVLDLLIQNYINQYKNDFYEDNYLKYDRKTLVKRLLQFKTSADTLFLKEIVNVVNKTIFSVENGTDIKNNFNLLNNSVQKTIQTMIKNI